MNLEEFVLVIIDFNANVYKYSSCYDTNKFRTELKTYSKIKSALLLLLKTTLVKVFYQMAKTL